MARLKLAHLSTVLIAGLATGVACSGPEVPESIDEASQQVIRDPNPESLRDATGGTSGKTPLDPSIAFDSRRDAFEDEDPSLGEDPDVWVASRAGNGGSGGTGALNNALHGNRRIRQYGFQWLRSYARNASVAIFQKQDFIPENGMLRLQQMRESPEPDHITELALYAKGWDLCPEEHFADQMRGGVNATPICSGTLIDKNLILTAAHCIRDTGDPFHGDSFDLKVTKALDPVNPNPAEEGPNSRRIENVRVAFGYVLSERGEQIRLKPGRDVFRVREVLTINRHPIDMSILQLLDPDTGQPITNLDPMYQPVPLWESPNPPPPAQTNGPLPFRSGANIGVGVRLPHKISTTRSWGWVADRENLGVTIRSDIFNGDSGGGVYDIDTGAYIGIMSSETPAMATITCPPQPATQNAFPGCQTVPVTPPGNQLQFPLFNIPRFTGRDANNIPIPKGCGQWVARPWSPDEQKLLEDHIKATYTVDDAKVTAGLGEDGQAVSINAVRSIACGAAASSKLFSDAVKDEAAALVARKASITAASDCFLTSQSNTGRCPSRQVIQDLPTGSQGGLFASFSDTQARQILLQSRLCTGTKPEPQRSVYSFLPQLKLESGRETTVHGQTTGGTDYFSTDLDQGFATPDALYRIEVDAWTVLYADTFSGGIELGSDNPGTNFDTVLFLKEADDDTDSNPNLVPSAWNDSTPVFDDSRCSAGQLDVNFQVQSQLTHVLQPGKKYILGVTGFGGQRGGFNLHLQSAPGPRVGMLVGVDPPVSSTTQSGTIFDTYAARPFVAAGEAEENCVDQDGAFDPTCLYNTVPGTVCQAPEGDAFAGEFGFITVSCPLSESPQFQFRVEGENFPFTDPVGAYWEGMQRHSSDGYLCSDDTVIDFRFPLIGSVLKIPSFSSEIGSARQVGSDSVQTRLTSGAGLRVFYAHQFKPFLDWQRIGYRLKLPRDAFHNIWTR